MGELAPTAGSHNYVASECGDKRRAPSSVQRHFVGLIPQSVRFTPENIDYSASCALSKKVRFYSRAQSKYFNFQGLSSGYVT